LPDEAAKGIIMAIKKEKDPGIYINVYSAQNVRI